MQLLKLRLSKVFIILKKPLLTLPALAVIVIVVISLFITRHDDAANEASQNKAMVQLQSEQKALAKKDLKDTSTKKSDVSELTFTDISTAAADKSTCGRLQNRPGVVITDSECDYKLRAFGDIDAAVVFVYDNGYSPSTYNNLRDTNVNNPNSLAYINTYYTQQAKRYKVTNPMHISMTYYGPYHTTSPVDGLYYYDNGETLLQTYQATATANKVPESNYDIVEYILLDNVYGGEAFPNLHQNFAYSQFEPGVLAHETLHLFGATDKYEGEYDNTCKADSSSDPFNGSDTSATDNDIMCDALNLNTANINPVTAREIGWAN